MFVHFDNATTSINGSSKLVRRVFSSPSLKGALTLAREREWPTGSDELWHLTWSLKRLSVAGLRDHIVFLPYTTAFTLAAEKRGLILILLPCKIDVIIRIISNPLTIRPSIAINRAKQFSNIYIYIRWFIQDYNIELLRGGGYFKYHFEFWFSLNSTKCCFKCLFRYVDPSARSFELPIAREISSHSMNSHFLSLLGR